MSAAAFRSGFTLLEAVLAVSLLAAVMVVCVGIRAQALAGARKIDERLALDRDTAAIFEMLSANLLAPPVVEPETLTRRWRGEHLGQPFTLVARRVVLPNPVYDADRPGADRLSDRIVLWRYELDFRGRTSTFLWHQ